MATFIALQVDEKEMEAEIEKEIEKLMDEEKKQAPPKKTPESSSDDSSISDSDDDSAVVEGMLVIVSRCLISLDFFFCCAEVYVEPSEDKSKALFIIVVLCPFYSCAVILQRTIPNPSIGSDTAFCDFVFSILFFKLSLLHRAFGFGM